MPAISSPILNWRWRRFDKSESVVNGSAGEVFAAFLKLGCTSFGGPIAHIGYFREELVVRRGWIDDRSFGELVGLCQFLPGPASSQAGFAMGLMRAGPLGGLAAWAGFTLPSALVMLALAAVAGQLTGPVGDAVVHGLKIAAVAIVAQALIGMAQTLTPDARRQAIAAAAAVITLTLAVPLAQIAVIVAGGIAGLWFCAPGAVAPVAAGWAPGRRAGVICLALAGTLLLVAPLFGPVHPLLALADVFYRAGALVFGGGHVVLPLIHASLVPDSMADSRFLAGYGAVQAMPGPLFTVSAFLGAVAMPGAPVAGATVALVAIFLPGLLLVAGALPFREALAGSARARSAVAGVNAAVVGILAAALYDPLWTGGIGSVGDAVIAGGGLMLLVWGRVAPILVVAMVVVAAIGALSF